MVKKRAGKAKSASRRKAVSKTTSAGAKKKAVKNLRDLPRKGPKFHTKEQKHFYLLSVIVFILAVGLLVLVAQNPIGVNNVGEAFKSYMVRQCYQLDPYPYEYKLDYCNCRLEQYSPSTLEELRGYQFFHICLEKYDVEFVEGFYDVRKNYNPYSIDYQECKAWINTQSKFKSLYEMKRYWEYNVCISRFADVDNGKHSLAVSLLKGDIVNN